MQLIRAIGISAARYVGENFHLIISKPDACPQCGAMNLLEALGYYSRNLTGARATVVRILVRRFRCRKCGKTVSILPSFVQPYRLIQNSTIERFFHNPAPTDVLWWQSLLRQYWKKFVRWLPELARIIGPHVTRSPPLSDAAGWWEVIVAAFGNLEEITLTIVRRYRTTLFGRYKCHFPAGSAQGSD